MSESLKAYNPDFVNLLPKRSEFVHKGDCGRIGVWGGSSTMQGAGILTAFSAMRTGCGLVYLVTADEGVGRINIDYPEFIVLPESKTDLEQCMNEFKFDVLAMGPGLGRNENTRKRIQHFLTSQNGLIPIVVDADALHAMTIETILKCNSDLVLTPHAGEFEILFGEPLTNDLEDRIDKAVKAARLVGQVVVLKGAQTIVTDGQEYYVNDTGNPGMATAGSGDVLTGMIASFIGQGVMPFEAAVLAVYTHGCAGDLAFDEHGNGLMASDIIHLIADAIFYIEEDTDFPDFDDDDDDGGDDLLLGGILPHELN